MKCRWDPFLSVFKHLKLFVIKSFIKDFYCNFSSTCFLPFFMPREQSSKGQRVKLRPINCYRIYCQMFVFHQLGAMFGTVPMVMFRAPQPQPFIHFQNKPPFLGRMDVGLTFLHPLRSTSNQVDPT